RTLREPVPGERGGHQRQAIEHAEGEQVPDHPQRARSVGAEEKQENRVQRDRLAESDVPGEPERLTYPLRAEPDEEGPHRRKRHRSPGEHCPARGFRPDHQDEGPRQEWRPHRGRSHRPRLRDRRHRSTRTEMLPSHPASSRTSIPSARDSATVAAPASTTLPGGSDRPRPASNPASWTTESTGSPEMAAPS